MDVHGREPHFLGEPGIYYKVNSDFYRYLEESATGDAESSAAEDAGVAHTGATKIAEKDSVVTHPSHSDPALNLTMFQFEVPRDPDETCKMECVAFEKVQKNVEIPQVQSIDKSFDVPIALRHRVLTGQTVQKTFGVLQVQFFDRVVGIPVMMQKSTILVDAARAN